MALSVARVLRLNSLCFTSERAAKEKNVENQQLIADGIGMGESARWYRTPEILSALFSHHP